MLTRVLFRSRDFFFRSRGLVFSEIYDFIIRRARAGSGSCVPLVPLRLRGPFCAHFVPQGFPLLWRSSCAPPVSCPPSMPLLCPFRSPFVLWGFCASTVPQPCSSRDSAAPPVPPLPLLGLFCPSRSSSAPPAPLLLLLCLLCFFCATPILP